MSDEIQGHSTGAGDDEPGCGIQFNAELADDVVAHSAAEGDEEPGCGIQFNAE